MIDLLSESCGIYRKTVDTSGKTDTETWALLETVQCRVLKNSTTKANLDNTQYATMIRARFVVPLSCNVAIRDRVSHGGRMHDVVEVMTVRDARKPHHKVAVCEVYAGGV